MSSIKANNLGSVISGENTKYSLGSLFFRAPANLGDYSMDIFFKTIFKSVLVKYKIKQLSDFHEMPLVSFKSSDFKRKTSLLALSLYLVRHYGFEVCSAPSNDAYSPEFSINKVLLSLDDFLFLSDKEQLVFKHRIIENKILFVVGSDPEISLSRERVRQIEQKLKQYLKMFMSSERMSPLEQFFENTSFVCGEDLSDIFETEVGFSIFKYLTSGTQTSIVRDAGFYRYSRSLDVFGNNPNFGVLEVVETMKEKSAVDSKILYSSDDIKNIFKLSPSDDAQSFFSCLIKRKIISMEGDNYFLYPTTKANAVEIFIALKGRSGYILKEDFDGLKDWIVKIFPGFLKDDDVTFKKKNFNSLIEHNANIVLWGWGVYVHKSSVVSSYGFPLDKELAPKINRQLADNAVANIKSLYSSLGDLCSSYDIPNAHALYTVARNSMGDSFDFKHSPWIRSLDADSDASIVSIVAESLKESGDKVSVRSVARNFGIDTARATQLLSHSEDVVSAGRGYFKYEKGGNK